MGEMFSTIAEACVWLYTQGFRQNESGHWLKGKRQAEIRRSPGNDNVVCVVMRNAAEPRNSLANAHKSDAELLAEIRAWRK